MLGPSLRMRKKLEYPTPPWGLMFNIKFHTLFRVVQNVTRKSITCYYMLYKGVATCYLNLLVISSCCFDTNSEMFLMIHLYQIAQLTTNGYYIFKQLSESVAQIMSQKMFLKSPLYTKIAQTDMDS